jgi:hypothetical protein
MVVDGAVKVGTKPGSGVNIGSDFMKKQKTVMVI